MSQLAKVAEIAGVSTADVARVARQGGTTAADWDIAAAIEAAGGRPAADIMWGPAHVPGTDTTPAPANPAAVHDPEVRIYDEATAPDAAPTALPDHPHDDDQTEDEAEDEATQVEELAAKVYSDLDDLLHTTLRSTGRLVRSWTTTAQARRDIHDLLLSRRRTRVTRPALAA